MPAGIFATQYNEDKNMPKKPQKFVDELQFQQMLLYSEIVNCLTDYYPIYSRYQSQENNVSITLLIENDITIPNSEWKLKKGSFPRPRLNLSFWARDDWNPSLDEITIATEIFMPELFFPLYYTYDMKKRVAFDWENRLPKKLNHDDYSFGVMDVEKVGVAYLYGNAKGTMEFFFDNNVESVVTEIKKEIEGIAKKLSRFWDNVAVTENEMLNDKSRKKSVSYIDSEKHGAYADGQDFALQMISYSKKTGR